MRTWLEFMGHCQSNVRPIHKMEAAEEKRAIAATLDTIGVGHWCAAAGLGWARAAMSRGARSIISRNAVCVCGGLDQRRPALRDERRGSEDFLDPYTADINDTSQNHRKNITSEFRRMIRRQCDVLLEEGQTEWPGDVHCVHPWIIGQPHRIGDLATRSTISEQDGVWLPPDRRSSMRMSNNSGPQLPATWRRPDIADRPQNFRLDRRGHAAA